jgi:DNA-binding response OmpR family regulator
MSLIAMDMELTLAGSGFAVTTVASSSEAQDWLARHRPDVVIVDIELRDGPCNDIVERLVQDNIPFIVHSGDDPAAHAGSPFANGRWINKPSDPGELVSAARSLLALTA